MTPRRRRAAWVLAALLATGTAAALVLQALRSNIAFYLTPSQVAAGQAPHGRPCRVGGLVARGSVVRDGLVVRFVLTDLHHQVAVRYEGLLPDLFREDRGAVVEGRLAADGRLLATQVLAKHDENYMPPTVRQAMSAPEGGR